MSVKLNERAYAHARELIAAGRTVHDDRDDWSEHRPTAADENAFIERHGFSEYRKWYLGLDVEHDEDTKARYKFPYGDFTDVHRCGVMSAESRAGQYKYTEIELAAAHLHGMLEQPVQAHRGQSEQ
ncbi:hypothetical protein E0H73_41740 [Kribbella pittospori]|uniref:Uncharacterized protein n=1 Tax=Kribbella pittospori TaxID=722689 RepID=A0A4R0JUV9_9ACTN|nr:hypothetical protein [Kribbella pittospori]TCC50357.1 hypothetical protein E0H73_41740 [Kribbella pittospori]